MHPQLPPKPLGAALRHHADRRLTGRHRAGRAPLTQPSHSPEATTGELPAGRDGRSRNQPQSHILPTREAAMIRSLLAMLLTALRPAPALPPAPQPARRPSTWPLGRLTPTGI